MGIIIQPKWPRTPTDLQTCLETNIASCTSCQGRSKDKPTCENRISKASRTRISLVVLEILKSGSLASAAGHLEHLASLVLCRRWHQNQVEDKIIEWKRRLREFLGLGKEEKEEGEEREEANLGNRSWSAAGNPTKLGKCVAGPLDISRTSDAEVSSQELKEKGQCERVVKQEIVKEDDDDHKIRLDSIPFKCLPDKPVISPGPPQKPTVHAFTPYSPLTPVSTINKSIVKKLSAPFTLKEQKAADLGYIYGYRLPKAHIANSGIDTSRVIKIGYTTNPQRRMREWESTCHYTPELIFTHKVPHHVKMEEIVHLHLRNERKWDRNCPGCGKDHKEFFEVDTEKARAIVGMWAAWARLRPFDAKGRLTEYWVGRLNGLDVEDAGCWDSFVLEKGHTKTE